MSPDFNPNAEFDAGQVYYKRAAGPDANGLAEKFAGMF